MSRTPWGTLVVNEYFYGIMSADPLGAMPELSYSGRPIAEVRLRKYRHRMQVPPFDIRKSGQPHAGPLLHAC